MDPFVIFSSDLLKLATLGVVALLLIAMPFFVKSVGQELPSGVSALYRKHAIETYIQTCFMLAPLILATYNGFRNNNLGFTITAGFLSICIFGGLASLWNTRKSWIEINSAVSESTDPTRRSKIFDIRKMTISIMIASFVSMGMGVAGFIYIYSTNTPFNWFWFLAFLMTMQPIQTRAWSMSILVVATKYASDPRFGERKVQNQQ